MRRDNPQAGVRVLIAVLLATSGCRSPMPSEDRPSEDRGPPSSVARLPVEESPVGESPVEDLPEGRVEKTLPASGVDRFRVDLKTDEFLSLVIEQHGVDLTIEILADDRLLLAIDSPSGARGDEQLCFLAPHTDRYTINLRGSGGTGFYVLHPPRRRPATTEDRLRAQATLAQGEGNRLRITRADLPGALARHEEALELWRRLGDRGREAMVLVRSGQIRGELRQRKEQIRNYEEALRVLRDQALGAQQIFAWLELGTARNENAEPAAALAAFEEALRLARDVEDQMEEATALNNIALLVEFEGRMQEALDLFRQVFALYEEAGRHDWAAVALRNLGFVQILAGQFEDAGDTLDRALRYQAPDDVRGRTLVLLHLGWIDYLEGQPAAALERYAEALALSRVSRAPEHEAGAFDRQGTALLALGRDEAALHSYRQALAIFRRIDHRQAVSHVEANLGRLHLRRGDIERATHFFETSLRAFRSSGDSHGEANALYLGSRIARRQGHFDEALQRAAGCRILAVTSCWRLARPMNGPSRAGTTPAAPEGL